MYLIGKRSLTDRVVTAATVPEQAARELALRVVPSCIASAFTRGAGARALVHADLVLFWHRRVWQVQCREVGQVNLARLALWWAHSVRVL